MVKNNMDKKLTMLMILDGFGENKNEKGNAVKLAKTPNIDKLMKTCPTTDIYTSGLSVGLPEGQMGNSEVGHTNIGAGRIVYQELTRITKSIEDGDFFSIPEFVKAIENCKKYNSKFPEELQKLNIKALEYYKMLNTKKKVNFEGWGTFHKLYKTEKFMYYIENFIILNMPCIGKEMFKLRLVIQKVLKKR